MKTPLPVDHALTLRLFGNNESAAQETLALFVAELPKIHDECLQLLQQRERAALERLIHKLHGACAYVGATLLKSHCYYLESQGKDMTWAVFEEEISVLMRMIQETVAFVNRL